MKVTFNINYRTTWGQRLYIVGSIPQLGSWEPVLAAEMHYVNDGNWQLQIEIPDDTLSISYRYFVGTNDKLLNEGWEKVRQINFDQHSTNYVLYDSWQLRPEYLAFYSSAFTKVVFAHQGEVNEAIVESKKRLVLKVLAPRVEKDQSLMVVGNQECLGHWNPQYGRRLSCDLSPEWFITLDADNIIYPLEYKFLVCSNETDKIHYWELGDNRVLHNPFYQDNETVVVSGSVLQDELPLWRAAGTVIPVFSLRSESGYGIGDLGDLRLMIDWAKKTRQHVIQVLPMNDTTSTHTWRDSYPYSAISVYALHPVYMDIKALGRLSDENRMSYYATERQKLNSYNVVDYEAAAKLKREYCREFFEQEGKALLYTNPFLSFFEDNKFWLIPYAAYCYLRDKYNTPDYTQWQGYSIYNDNVILKLTDEDNEAWPEIAFVYFVQYNLHIQFKAVSDYAREQNVILKGDLPIGVNRASVDVWKEPRLFNLVGQAGAPPDAFSDIGQNWRFPTYNWDEMAKDGFAWWKKRFRKLGDYFDSFRIDHILGFFRIWEIPIEYVQGLCGHFNPALPLSREDIESYGLSFDENKFTNPRIHRKSLYDLFVDFADEVERTYLIQSASEYLVLKPFCDTQQEIFKLFEGKNDEKSLLIRNGLYRIANEVLFLHDPHEPHKFHPRISANTSFIYHEMDGSMKDAFDRLYWDFFYHRHNDFWKEQAYKRLEPLMSSTEMLVCGEDLGMIPQSVPEVMNAMQILSLEIERMPKSSDREFADLERLPYLSVCTTSTHDMSPLRNWWKEDPGKTQRYYNQVLHREGEAPQDCSSELAMQIVGNHLSSPSLLAILPLQDWFAIDESIRHKDIHPERINVPANPEHYWQYRMHITLEKLLNADSLNEKVISLISSSGRD